MDLNKILTTTADSDPQVHQALLSQIVVLPRANTDGRTYTKRMNGQGKVKKVFRCLKHVEEVDGAKEFDDDYKENCNTRNRNGRRCSDLSVKSGQGRAIKKQEMCEYSHYTMEDFFRTEQGSKDDFKRVFKKSYKAMKQLSKKLHNHQLASAGLTHFA